jgi:hypothetical protein
MVGIETKLSERIAHRNSAGVPGAEHALDKGSGDRAATQQRRGKPNPFFVGKADHFDRERQAPPSFVQIGDTGDRRNQSERAVPFAGIADGIVMGAQHQAGQSGTLAFVAAADISNGVEMRAHSG